MESPQRTSEPESALSTADDAGAGAHVLRVRLLGDLDLQLGDVPLPPLDSARAESLLAYLLLHRDAPQPRQHLAFLLWPDSSEQQARTNLRHVLHTLRRALPQAERFIDAGPRTLQWRAGAPLRLDVARFEDALARAGREEADQALAALQEAVEAYTGDLLEGSYDEWLLELRDQLRQRYLDALERLVLLLEERGEHARAVPYAERLLRQEPLREETYRLLMRLHDARGDRARALRVFHQCEAALERELGVEPSAPTREAYEALLPAGDEAGERHARPRPAGARALVGRAAERRHLAGLWREAERGRAQLVLVTGEPGIGKTRLLEELRAFGEHRGAVAAAARSYAAEGALAYGPVVTWLRSERLAARRGRLEPRHLDELARLLPELAEDGADSRAEPLSEGEQRQRLFDAIARALLSTDGPLLLVADDLQWCDRETLRLIHYLLRAEPEARLLVAAAARREEVDPLHPLCELVAGLRASERFAEIELERLSRQELALLAERAGGRRLGAQERELLFAETEGNPLFAVEALRAGWGGASTRGEWPSPKVQAVLESRLAQLSAPARSLVGLAAAIGREFSTDLLGAAAAAGEEALVRGLDELWRRRIVRELGADSYDFSHDKLREAAYATLSPPQATSHHLRIARALEEVHAHDLDAVGGRIAAHYDRAGRQADAVAWYARAAEAAQRLHANADAVQSLERALELARELPGPERAPLELRLLTALPAPLVAVEGYLSPRVAAVHERARELAEAHCVEPEAPLLRSLALAALARGDFDAARLHGEQLRARGERERDDVLGVESAYVLGVAAYWQCRLEDARAELETAVERCRPEHRTAHLLHYGQDPEVVCLTRLAHTLWLLGREEEAARAGDTGVLLADERGHPYSLAVARIWAALLALDRREHAALRRHARALEGAEPVHGPAQHRLAAEAFSGLVDVLDGRENEGLERVREALGAARSGQPPAPGIRAILTRILLEAYATAGAAQAGLAEADEALAADDGVLLWEAEARRLRAEFLQALGGATAGVEAELARAGAAARRQGARAFELRIRESLERLRGTARGTLAERHVLDDGPRTMSSKEER
jgi:DNA-binding SARP family transcriptional activator